MSEDFDTGGQVGQRDDAGAAAAHGELSLDGRRRLMAVMLILLALAAGSGIGWAAGAFRSNRSAGPSPGAAPPATATVARTTLSSQSPVNATLGYAGLYTVRAQGGGTLTWLPPAGRVIRQGQALYRVDNASPVVLLYGRVPAWRTMAEGVIGADVSQLNHDLVALGDASKSAISAVGWDYFSWRTALGVRRMESALGVSGPPGSMPLGSVTFEAGALRVGNVTASLGDLAVGPVLAATSDRHVVTIALSTAQQSQVAPGDAVTVTLPDGASTTGKVSSLGTVASGTGSNATIPVTVTLEHPSAAGTLDQAPVTVNITTSTSHGPVLVVPVAALLAQSSGGYAVEVVGASNTRRLVPVTVGIFNDNSDLVQVTGALTPGQHVVVPVS